MNCNIMLLAAHNFVASSYYAISIFNYITVLVSSKSLVRQVALVTTKAILKRAVVSVCLPTK